MKNSNLTLLKVLLVLTFISAGLNLFSYGILSLSLPWFKQTLADNPGLVPEQVQTTFDMILGLPRSFFSVSALLYALELLGAVLMWKLRRSGFHCYTLSRLLLLLIPVLFIGRDYLRIGEIMFAALFILAYYLILKSLDVFKAKDDLDDDDSNTDASTQ